MKDKQRRSPGKAPPKSGPSRTSAPLAGPSRSDAAVVPPLKAGAKPAAQEPHGQRSSSRPQPASPRPSPSEPRQEALAPVTMRPRTGDKPAERVPVILETAGEADYRLVDSGDALKLEQYGPYTIVRPEAQALWPKSQAPLWERADAIFTGDTDEDGMGRWRFPREMLGETWPMRLLDAEFYGRFTSFRHVGVFPEQLAHWRWMKTQVEDAGRPLKVLNLFGYTGVASLIAAKAGAEVTHVDASKKAIGWGRENQALGRGESLPIRWICDDAMKFIQREERRGSRYDIILTDPPKFGRGPNGEVWHLFDHLSGMLDICRELLSDDARGLVLTAYSIRASFYSIHELMREVMRGRGGVVESGELILRESAGSKQDGEAGSGRALSTSLFSRWVPK
ncbi:class I SAM-dependent rRNA methyltransferase [Rhizobiaceae bacterium CRRU44]|uniref:Class I SAM-dependent rRNA methyltransferase n=1 Tax=Ferranicluibacter rubi TaxID=2715133 RepID=A0AA43ZCA0_9HYPH|nr:class I SAM-dependent methyltransferase [Ferranicluibacter rubi]NHT74531.1 class I SAM-dependent rRNA methyltransferase [Ferranicluibacter rubi]